MATFLDNPSWIKENLVKIIFSFFVLVFLAVLSGGFQVSDYFIREISTPLINIAFLLILLVSNIYFLIPEFLKGGNWLKYGISLLACLLIISPLKVFALFIVYRNDPYMQGVLLDEQMLYFAADVMVIFLSTTINLSLTWFNQQRIVRELEHQNIQSEIKFLKAQINPHFLFNTLNNIYSLSLKKDDLAPEAILKLSNILRYILYECNEREVPIESEWKHILDFIELEKLRMSKEMSIFLEYDIEDPKAKIAPLIIMTFVENAFKHGNRSGGEDIDIAVKLIQTVKEGIEIEVSNKFGDNRIEKTRSRGIGLENVKKRLRLLYPQRFKLKIEAVDGRHIVNLKIKP